MARLSTILKESISEAVTKSAKYTSVFTPATKSLSKYYQAV